MMLDGEMLYDAERDGGKAGESALREKRLNFGLVFQSFHLFPQYNVMENITLAPMLALEEKIKRKAFDFDDIRRFAYQLLTDKNGEPSDIALAYKEQFDEIYIDEYQDVDAMQDRIFSLISKGNNRFMRRIWKMSLYMTIQFSYR